MSDLFFEMGDIVQHLKSGNCYKIVNTPSLDVRLEHCDEPFYSYTDDTGGIVWLRCESEMEDGRFSLAFKP